MTACYKLTFFHDPGHAWLRVPAKLLKTLGIERRISFYSYVSPNGKYVYLEEDCDMGRFIEAARREGLRYDIKGRRVKKNASCRRYARYRYDLPELV